MKNVSVEVHFEGASPDPFELLVRFKPNDSIEVVHCVGDRMLNIVTFPPGAIAGQVACQECGGTGWWGYGPSADTCGPCVCCKGTGREWLGL